MTFAWIPRNCQTAGLALPQLERMLGRELSEGQHLEAGYAGHVWGGTTVRQGEGCRQALAKR